jgi:hypothetical protein
MDFGDSIRAAGISMAKKKQRGRPVLSMEYYIVQITEWDWSYSFSVNVPKWDDRRYSNYRHLLVRGNVLLPSSLMAKAETAELTFMPDVREADFEPGDRAPPRGVGHLNIHNRLLSGGFSMAADGLEPVMQMLLADRVKYVVMHGESMRYRKALIRHYQLVSQLDPEEYPDGSAQ